MVGFGTDEKAALLLGASQGQKRSSAISIPTRHRVSSLLLIGLTVAYLILRSTLHSWSVPEHNASESNGRLRWESCGPNIDCTTLLVPRDYTSSDPWHETFTLALTRYRATASPSLGSLIVEPGGPGGSGTAMIWTSGANISRVVGGAYDIVGFDPRGINKSEPTISCWETEEERAIYARAVEKLPSDGPGSLAEVDAWYEVMGKGCEEQSGGSLALVSTAFVARDLDEIRDALDQDKLIYWGFSYGTGIGATYTGMFPDNVGRVVLDACEYPVDGRSALMWGKTSLDDTVSVFDAFLETCASVGSPRCALIHEEGTTAVDLRLQIESLLLSVGHRPIPVSSGPNKGTVTRHALISYLYTSLYRPNVAWPRLAEVLDALITQRNGTLLLQELAWKEGPPHNEEGLAVLCSDALPANDISLEEWAAQTEEMREKSFISGELRSLHTLPCRTWHGRPKERYLGNFTQKLANPVLLIGGTHDPATPLRNARRLAKDMGESARLIVHHGFGHTSTRHVSNCTTQAVRNYLLQGDLPEDAETHCPVSEELFPLPGSQEFGSMQADERDILLAMQGIGAALSGW